MKYFVVSLFAIFLLFAGCSKEKPKSSEHSPITISAMPRETVKVVEHWKMEEFVVGYRIVTDEYVITSGLEGLFGQGGEAFGGPEVVLQDMISRFARVVDLAERVKNKKEITFHGPMVYNKNGEPYLFEGRKVMELFYATYNGQNYKVN